MFELSIKGEIQEFPTDEEIEESARDLIRSVIPDLDHGEIEKDDEGNYIKTTFIGTVFAIMPSGKYYLPFACSNVDICPYCDGNGSTPNTNLIIKEFSRYYGVYLYYHDMIEKGEISYSDLSRDERIEYSDAYDYINILNPSMVECPLCCGVGSREAYEDQVFQESLEKEAEKHHAWISSGEGDPCDILISRFIDTYHYHINLDERGEFFADVRDDKENSVFEVHGYDIFNDGFMADNHDIDGLRDHLVSVGVMVDDGILIDDETEKESY